MKQNHIVAITMTALLVVIALALFAASKNESRQTEARAATQQGASNGMSSPGSNPAAQNQASNQQSSASEKPFDPFEGLVLGGSLPQTVTALKRRGFPTNQGCNDEGDGYETCLSMKGEPDASDFEVLQLRIHDAHVYVVMYEFPKDKYDSILGALTEAHGEPSHKQGVTFWNLGTEYTRILASSNGETYKGHKLAYVTLADVKAVADKEAEDAVNGRGQFAR